MKAEFLKSAVTALFLSLALVFSAVAEENFPIGQARIVTTSGASHIFVIELASTPSARAQGLMHRTELGINHGMVFDFGETREVTMWMRNTPLPLDMLFVTEDGVISHIAENTVPFSETIVGSRGPVRFVLELNAGRSKALGITPGAKLSVAAPGTALK